MVAANSAANTTDYLRYKTTAKERGRYSEQWVLIAQLGMDKVSLSSAPAHIDNQWSTVFPGGGGSWSGCHYPYT
jgi:hypothetical protein